MEAEDADDYVKEMLIRKRDLLYEDIRGLHQIRESLMLWKQASDQLTAIMIHLTENLNDIQDELEEEWDVDQIDFYFMDFELLPQKIVREGQSPDRLVVFKRS